MRIYLSSLILFIFLPTICNASIDTYDCKVLSLNELKQDSTLNTNNNLKSSIKFSVNQKSGEIRGDVDINNRGDESIKVIDNNPSKGGFYVISQSYGPAPMVSYLFINVYEDKEKHPFVYTLSGQYVYTGECQSCHSNMMTIYHGMTGH